MHREREGGRAEPGRAKDGPQGFCVLPESVLRTLLQAALPGEYRSLRAVADVELAEHVADVRLDGLLADAEALGDQLVVEAFGDQGEHLAFALAEQIEHVAARFAV